MKLQPFLLHQSRWLLLVVLTLVAITITAYTSVLRPLSDVNWLDSVGEGGLTLMTLIWIAVTLLTRPKGLVTNLLFAGLSAMYVSMLWDFLDEMVVFTPHYLTSFEAIPACFGMVLMSISAYYWYKEQSIFNQTLMKKERFYRDHSMTDFVTGLYSVEYMQNQVRHEQSRLANGNSPFCLTLFDICDFAAYARQHGMQKSNQLLRDIADMLSLSMRESDLLCRFAADKFVVVHPHSNHVQAQAFANRAAEFIARHANYDDGENQPQYSAVRWSCIEVNDKHCEFESLIAALVNELNQAKVAAA
ncbi:MULTISPECIES: GGDEF domain-containing protein [Pseudoalteromonas]|uniref:GGDEF domain-containing protein n=1 Tax=Pseudoalteromonas TaxID=53246 RepID=UPI000299E530|nr:MULTISPECIES: diguanylate cyclase [Pseudoalteromonas]AUJ72586.1 Response regulator PleD [Pseudoalteromonas sp. NC201]MCF7516119.1 diguanylate cyclase [Pseudoalteromonas sp. L7]MCF7528186.1 diguanylate cyclase [Pseudoalteromonas sp. L23]